MKRVGTARSRERQPEIELGRLVAVVCVRVQPTRRCTTSHMAAKGGHALKEEALRIADLFQHHLSQEAHVHGVELCAVPRALVQPALNDAR